MPMLARRTRESSRFADRVVTDPEFARRAEAAVRAVADCGGGAPLRPGIADPPAPEPGAVLVLRAAVSMLHQAVHEADLGNVGEFHALFQLMLGLGVDPPALAERLEVGIATIGRYAGGTSAPATVHARRGALIETARMVEQRLGSGDLQCLMHLRRK